MKETREQNYKPSKNEIKSGDWIVTEYLKWLYQKRGISDLKPKELFVIMLILESSFRYGCKYAYLSYDDFGFSKATLSNILKSLEEREVIKKENSYEKESHLKRKNKYTLLYPEYLKFKFYCKKQQKELGKINKEEILKDIEF